MATYTCSGVLCQRRVPVTPPLTALINYSKAILRIDGQWVELEYPTAEAIASADIYVPGGYESEVDTATARALVNAGYIVDGWGGSSFDNQVGTAIVGSSVLA